MQWASLLRLRFVLCEASAVRCNSHASDSIHNYCIYCERAWVNLFICAHSLPFPAPPDAAYLTAFEAKFVNRRLTKMISTQNRLQQTRACKSSWVFGGHLALALAVEQKNCGWISPENEIDGAFFVLLEAVGLAQQQLSMGCGCP